MDDVILSMVRRITGAWSPKLYCPQIPHISLFSLVSKTRVQSCPLCERKKQTKAPEHLRLSPPMHRSVVPTKQKLTSSKTPVRFLPSVQIDKPRQGIVQFGKTSP